MAEGIGLRACPYLTLSDDPTLVLSEGSAEHVCRAQRRRFSPDLDFQESVCLRAAHVECQRFVKAQAANVPLPGVTVPTARRRTRTRGYVPVLTALVLVFGAALVVTALLNLPALFPDEPQPTEVALLQETPPPQATEPQETEPPTETAPPAETPSPIATPSRAAATAAATMAPPTPTRASASGVATRRPANPPAVIPGDEEEAQVIALLPTATAPAAPSNTPGPTPSPTLPPLRLTPVNGSSVGWWSSDGAAGANLGDSFLYAGTAAGDSLLSAVRFDLARIARGAPVLEAYVELTGLVEQRLDRSLDTIWLVQLIAENELAQLVGGNYMMLYSAPAAITLLPELRTTDLAEGQVNRLTLDANARQWLEQRILDGERSVTVRLVASTRGEGDTLFAWDSGFGSKTTEQPPALVLNLGAPPPTPPPLPTREYIVATFTPVPENVLTVVAQQATATEEARINGTPTPAPPFVTPTTIPENLPTAQAAALQAGLPAVVAHTPTPANAETATAVAAYATAVAVTTGTFTPVPTGYVTPFVILPQLPAENAATEIARIAQATAEAQNAGVRPTQPHNAVLGVYVIATPTPANIATAAAESLAATRSAQLGTPTPTPWHWILITPTPLPVPTEIPTLPPLVLSDAFTPTPIPTPTDVVPDTLPAEFRNLIFFRTLRGPLEEMYALNPATNQLGAVTRPWIYPLARKQLTLSPDGKQEAVVKRDANGLAQIHILTFEYGTTRQITSFGANSYDPTWSPNGDWIAFVSTNTRNDEIYIISTDGSIVKQLTNNTWEWDKHPTWSPDGSQIVWFSNRETGTRQLWIMNADGSNQRRLLDDEYENWDPVWTR